MTHKELVEIGYKWMLKRCGFAFKELVTMGIEVPDVIGFLSGESFLIECKVSKTDFLSDKKKIFRINPSMGMGKFRFYLCPTGLIDIIELPDNWGLIYVNEQGITRCVYNPYGKGNIYSLMTGFAERNKEKEAQMMYSALRRLHLRKRLDEIYLPLSDVKGLNDKKK